MVISLIFHALKINLCIDAFILSREGNKANRYADYAPRSRSLCSMISILVFFLQVFLVMILA